MSTDNGYTDQQIRSIASALRHRGEDPHRADELDAAVALEWLYRERAALIAKLDRIGHAVHIVTRDLAAMSADQVRRELREAMDEVAW